MTSGSAGDVKQAWFPELDGCIDPGRPDSENVGPHLIVIDDFYDDPDAVRTTALQCEYAVYAPPSRWDLSPARRLPQAWEEDGLWLSSSLASFHGKPTPHQFDGYRYNPDWLREAMQNITGDVIAPADWEPGGDGWNGAFHLRDASHQSGAVHHHYHASALSRKGWSGVLYLTPDAPPESGTSFYRDRASQRCVAGYGEFFDFEHDRYEEVLRVDNVFNRLVLFRENLLHFAHPGFGQGVRRRLTQTFFFAVSPA